MDWTQAFAIIGCNIALVGAISAFILWAFNKLDTDIKSLSNKVDADMKVQTARTDQLAMRMDQLYQMFIDLLKERK